MIFFPHNFITLFSHSYFIFFSCDGPNTPSSDHDITPERREISQSPDFILTELLQNPSSAEEIPEKI